MRRRAPIPSPRRAPCRSRRRRSTGSRTAITSPPSSRAWPSRRRRSRRIADNPAPPTFDNTIAALERSGRMLDRVNEAFFGVVGRPTPIRRSTRYRRWRRRSSPQHQDAIYLNPKLFARVKALYTKIASASRLDPEQQQLLEHLLSAVRPCRRAAFRRRQGEAARAQHADLDARDRVPAEAARRHQGRRAGGRRQGRARGPRRAGRSPRPPRRRRTASLPANGSFRCRTRPSSPRSSR